jgi:hypothetical protein
MKSFFVPSDSSYFVEISEPSKKFLEEHPRPEGAIEVDERPEEYFDYIDGSWVENADRKLNVLSSRARIERDSKLFSEVDPIASNNLRWAELPFEKQAEWTQYRTDLLNVPQQSGFPTSISWPSKPD